MKLKHKPRHWLNVKVGHNQQTNRHFFLLAPGKNCDEYVCTNLRAESRTHFFSKPEDVPKFYHLAQLVEPVKTRPDRVEPWTALVTYCSSKNDRSGAKGAMTHP